MKTYTPDEIRQKIAIHEYSAELLLQHAMTNIQQLEQQLAAAKSRIKELEQKSAYGCHVDLEHGVEPDACVLDSNEAHLCIYARKLVETGKDKTACKYWKIIRRER